MAFFRKIKAGLVKSEFEEYVGEIGQIFFNIETGEFRLSNESTPGGSPIFTFLQLSDTPSSYVGAAGKFLAVNVTEDGIEFVDAASGSSFNLKGSVASAIDLPLQYIGDNGDAFVSRDDTHIHIWDGTQWINLGAALGPIQGFAGSQGDLGFTGSIGFTGSQGNIGFSGSQGDTGSKGDVGFTGSIGFTGSKGDVGFTGSIGFTGSQGIQGDTGSQGDIGYTGSSGFTGSRGDVGFAGSAGQDGLTGADGFTGSQGDIGHTGSQGQVGFSGSQGALGYSGSVGFTGSQGDIGYVGSQGDTGFTGSVGFTGSRGDTGFTGSKGADGTSVQIMGSVSTFADLPNNYLGSIGDGFITTDNGHLNIWTGSSWSDVGNIVGPQGELGYAGSKGYTGSEGTIGYTGSQGDIGYVGTQGDVGFTGSAGVDGIIGVDGFTGSQGDVGFTGSAGVDGIIGVDGFTGSQGDVGYVGSQGELGFIGYTGSAVPGMVSDGIDTITIEAGYNIVPATDGLQSLGSPTAAWGEIYVSGNSIYLGGNIISINADGSLDITDAAGDPIPIRAKNFFVGRQHMPAYTQGTDITGVVFPDGTLQTTSAPKMYTNADAANGLSLSDLKPGDFYFDDVNAAIFICFDTGLGYFDILDLTVRA